MVENHVRQLVLGHAGRLVDLVGVHEAYCVVVGAECQPLANSIGDDDIGVLFHKLRLGVSDDVVGFGSEAHHNLVRALLRPERGKDIRVLDQCDGAKVGIGRALLQLMVRRMSRAHIGDGCGEQRDIGGGERLFASLQHLERGVHVHHVDI